MRSKRESTPYLTLKHSLGLLPLAGGLTLAVTSQSATAANKTWDGGGTTDNWTDAANWNAALVANDTLFFDGNTRLTPNNNFAAGTQFNGITFNATAGGFTVGGNGILLHGSITDSSTLTQTVDLDLAVTPGMKAFSVAAGGTLRVNGDVSGEAISASGGHLVLAGDVALTATEALRIASGQVTLSGNNSAMTGGVVLRATAERLNIASATALGSGTFQVSITSGAANFDNTSGGALTLTTNPQILWQGEMHFLGTNDLHLGNGAVSRIGTGARTVTVDQKTLTIGGVVSDATNGTPGPMGIAKQGAGTLVLSGVNSYTGATIVIGGALLVNGDQSSATGVVSVNSTLGGTGIVGGATTINSGGTLSAGNGPGILTINNNLTLKNGATAIFEGGDLMDVNGILDLDNDWTLKLTSGFVDGGSTVLFTYDTLAAIPDLAPTFDITALGFTPSGTLSLTNTGSAIVVNGISVPEPAMLGLFGLGGLLIAGRRSRRQRRTC